VLFEIISTQVGSLSDVTPSLILTLGFVIGIQHATEADHVAAVATLVGKNKRLRNASLLGVFWGAGHTATLVAAGTVVMLFAVSIPSKLANILELGVGIMLVTLGLSVVRKIWNIKPLDYFFGIFSLKHTHPHLHNDHIHIHEHEHDEAHTHSHKSILVGMVHGLAGSGALMLIVLSTVDSIMMGLLYILLFGIGSIIGMLGISTALGLPFVFTAKKYTNINKYIRVIAASISIALGILIIYEIGFTERLIF